MIMLFLQSIWYDPLVKHWTMHFEAKHNHLKNLAQHIGNFVNISWTLACGHQYWQCYKWMDGDALEEDGLQIGRGKVKSIITGVT